MAGVRPWLHDVPRVLACTTIEDFIIALFYAVDQEMLDVRGMPANTKSFFRTNNKILHAPTCIRYILTQMLFSVLT